MVVFMHEHDAIQSRLIAVRARTVLPRDEFRDEGADGFGGGEITFLCEDVWVFGGGLDERDERLREVGGDVWVECDDGCASLGEGLEER